MEGELLKEQHAKHICVELHEQGRWRLNEYPNGKTSKVGAERRTSGLQFQRGGQ